MNYIEVEGVVGGLLSSHYSPAANIGFFQSRRNRNLAHIKHLGWLVVKKLLIAVAALL